METILKLAISFAAGLLSFLTPCVLPLVPSYITFIGGTTLQEMNEAGYDRKRLFVRTLFFVLGFTSVFIMAGIFLWGAFSLVGQLSATVNAVVNIIAGGIIILLGLNIIFDFIPILLREARAGLDKRPENNIGALFAGFAFGAGWSPCIGPLLGGIIALTATGDSVFGIINLVFYSLGLGVPFILLSLAFIPVSARLAKAKKHFRGLKTIAGIFLIIMGVFTILGQLIAVNAFMTGLAFAIKGINGDLPWLFPLVSAIFFVLIGMIPVIGNIMKNRVLKTGTLIPGMFGKIWFVIFMILAVMQIFNLFPIIIWFSDWLLVQELLPLHF